jgi:hypothetical protein
MAAEAALLHMRTASGCTGRPRDAVKTCFEDVRIKLAQLLNLQTDTRVVLTPSGTDAELLALAVCHLGGDPGARICNILIEPQETGRGVPLAAQGLHFAVNTAQGDEVTPRTLIAGFRPDTCLWNIALRDGNSKLRPVEKVEAEIWDAVREALAREERVLLHVLDISKSGLLAPRLEFVEELRRVFAGRFDIVVDACQTRLSPASISRYLALDAMVLITGSKFFTGPPFAGAALLPASLADRLSNGVLPSGLDSYFSRDEFFDGCPAARALRPAREVGLALRWHASLAEMEAFFCVPLETRIAILKRFGETVRAAISGNPLFELIETPQIFRHEKEESWERARSIFAFAVRRKPRQGFLDCEQAHAIYRWLNADLSRILPHEHFLASKICHIGQPLGLAGFRGGKAIGALRISAGARLLTGELSHAHLNDAARIEREMRDVRTVFEKIDLILRNWSVVKNADPKPNYASSRLPQSGFGQPENRWVSVAGR